MKFRKILAIMMTVLMLVGMMPAASAMNLWCPDEGLSHRWGPTEWWNADTCGIISGVHYCTRCGAGEEVAKEVPHSWGSWRGELDIPCGGEGYRWRECRNCGTIDEELISREHVLGPWVQDPNYDPPTCVEGSIEVRICKICGEAWDEREVGALGHNWRWYLEHPGDCMTPETENAVCSRCGEVDERTGGYGDHVWGDWDWAHGTPGCDHGAWMVRECQVCGAMEDKWVEGGDHKWGDWKVVEQASCTIGGEEQRKCSVCGKIQARETDSIGHKWGDWENVHAATCVSTGENMRRCSRCNDVEFAKTDYGSHKWGEWKLVDKGDCKHPGKEERKCSVCGKTESRETEEGGHNWSGWKTEKEATCTENGKKVRKCSLCGKEQIEKLEMLGHKWGEWVVIQEADPYGQVGIRERKCSRCGKTEREYFYPDGMIEKGDKGEEVEDLQEKLNELGHNCGKADGDFGKKTEEAVKEWQEANGYTPDGKSWPGQRAEMFGEDDDKKYTSSVSLVVNGTLPESIASPSVGDVVTIPLLVSNTGETELYNYSLYIAYNTTTYTGEDSNWTYGWNGLLDPGASYGSDQICTITQHDIDEGKFYREIGMSFAPRYYTGTDVLSVLPVPEGHDGSVEHRHAESVSAMVAVCIPFTSGGNDGKDRFIDFTMEFAQPLPDVLDGVSAGEVIDLPMRMVNTGNTCFDISDAYIKDGDGNWVDLYEYPDWEYNVTPGQVVDDHYHLVITERDIELGKAIRTYDQYAYTRYYKGTDLICGIDPQPDGHNGETEYRFEDNGVDKALQGVRFEIPLIPSGNADFQYVTVEKSIISTPANGEYYVQGETISFLIKVIIPEGKTVMDLEITDPLKGNNEDSTMDRLPVATSGDKLEYIFNYVVTAEDVERGYVENSACAYFFDPEGDAWVEEWSETVGAPTGGEIYPESIVLTKSVTNMPEDGIFHNGNTIQFEIQIANVSDETYYDVIVYDPILEFAELKTYDVMEPGFTDTIGFSYDVSIADALAGYVENTAFVIRPDGADFQDRIYSNKVTVPCEVQYFFVNEITYFGGLEVTKSEVSVPANGQFYQPGETVTFQIDVTNKHETLAMLDVVVTDALMEEFDGDWECQYIDPGMTESFTFDYVVTPMDAIAGSISNVATAEARIATGDPTSPKGAKHVGISNTVVVPAGMEGDFPFGVITEMTIVKEETSTPANGSYYTEGETIHYTITYTNTGETNFGETIIYDTLAAGNGEIASAEMLTSGDSRICYFSHVVTAADVARGYVANSAVAKYDIGGGYINSAISNVVVSDTDGNPNTTYVPGDGKINWEEIRENGADANGNALPAGDTCYVEVVSRDGDTVEYEMHFCSEHAQTQNAILTMAEANNNESMQQMVWGYALALWQKDIDAMYEEILTVCDDAAKITVMCERVNFLAMVANTQLALKIAEPGQSAETIRAVAELWQKKCVELCYLMNTAPADRNDSIFAVERMQSAGQAAETCSCVIAEEAKDKILYVDQYCAVHAFTYEMMEALLLADGGEEDWTTVRTLWEIELKAAYNTLYKNASEEGGMAYLAEYAVFMNWLPAYEEFLNLAYPAKPWVADEVMVNTIMERVLDACGK